MKFALRSRTILSNLVLLALAFVPGWGNLVARYPEISTIVVALLGIGLRLITQMPVWIR